MIYKHVVYNPHLSNLDIELSRFLGSEWQLSHVVPVTQYEWVIVMGKEVYEELSPTKHTGEEK